MTVLSAMVTGLVVFGGRWLVPRMAGSLTALAVATGASVLAWWATNLVVNLLGTTSLAVILFHRYQRYSGDESRVLLKPEFVAIDADNPWLRLTRARLVLVAAAGCLGAIIAGILFERSVQLEDNTGIMAHRGASAAAPENTMAAVRQAIADGADWVEIDVQETRDGEVVVFHDSDFMKLAGNPLKLWDATLLDLEAIDIGSWFDPKFGEERVPTLKAVLEECRGRIGVNIELKYYGHDQQLEQRVAEIVEACGMSDQIVIMSLKLPAVEKMKSLRPGWRVGLLMSVAAGDLKKINADFLAVNASFVDRSFVRAVHAIKKQVFVWTVNDPVSMSTLIGQGVDCLITDEPALARIVLQQRAELSTPERLMLELAGLFGIQREIASQ
jgi:glycerophosphoryl diester phosphodiesterase